MVCKATIKAVDKVLKILCDKYSDYEFYPVDTTLKDHKCWAKRLGERAILGMLIAECPHPVFGVPMRWRIVDLGEGLVFESEMMYKTEEILNMFEEQIKDRI